MKTNHLLVLLAIFSVIVIGCAQISGTDVMEKKDATMEKDDSMMKKDDAMTDNVEGTKDKMTVSGYTGKILAGTETTKYLDFNKADYDKALKEKKKILLYFYANWCPICRLEQPKTFAAFNEINDPELIGFRVNYRDSNTDAYEESLAKEFGVSYQHTKVILKNGERVLKAPDTWDKQRYLEELNKV